MTNVAQRFRDIATVNPAQLFSDKQILKQSLIWDSRRISHYVENDHHFCHRPVATTRDQQ